MKADLTKIKTAQDLLVFCRELGATQITALNGLLDKVPEPLKAEYLAMRDKMNGLLEKLPPLDQVPAAQDAAWALNSFARTIDGLFEYIEMSRQRFGDVLKSLGEKQTALNGWDEKVTKKELLDAATVTAATETAVANATKPLLEQIATMRGEQVALCGLPEAPAGLLSGPADAFATALEQAKKNLGALKTRGFELGKKGDAFIKKTVWLDATAFQGENQTLNDLAESLKVKIPGTADPMIGGGGAGGQQQQSAPTARKVTVC